MIKEIGEYIIGRRYRNKLTNGLHSYSKIIETLGTFSSDYDCYYHTVKLEQNYFVRWYVRRIYGGSGVQLYKGKDVIANSNGGVDPYIDLIKFEKIYKDIMPQLKALENDYYDTRNSINERV